MRRTIPALIFLLIALALARTAAFTVREGETAVVTRFGRPAGPPAGPGLHFKMPWPIDAVARLDRRLLIFDNEPVELLTRDKKNVLVDSFLAWRIADPLLYHRTVRSRIEAEARLLDLVAAELGAAVGAEPMDRFVAVEPAADGLAEVARRARAAVDRAARESFGIEVVDLGINGFNLPLQNRRSVIERMQAERARIATAYRSEGEEEALKIEALSATESERVLAEARSRAEAIRGAGEAEALRILGEAYRADPELYRFLRGLESSEAILDERTTVFLESDSGLLEVLHGR